MITDETWTKLQEVLVKNADYQYLLNYGFLYLCPAKTLEARPMNLNHLWELFNLKSERELLEFLSTKNWFSPIDWNQADIPYIVNRLVAYFTAIVKYELIAKRVMGIKYPSQNGIYYKLYKAGFFERDLVLIMSEDGQQVNDTFGIYMTLDCFDSSDYFRHVLHGLISVNAIESSPSYKKFPGENFKSIAINDIKIKDFQKFIDRWDRM